MSDFHLPNVFSDPIPSDRIFAEQSHAAEAVSGDERTNVVPAVDGREKHQSGHARSDVSDLTDDRWIQLQEKEAILDERYNALDRQTATLETRRAQLSETEANLAQREALLAEREANIASKERDAELGFARQRRESLVSLEREWDAAATQLTATHQALMQRLNDEASKETTLLRARLEAERTAAEHARHEEIARFEQRSAALREEHAKLMSALIDAQRTLGEAQTRGVRELEAELNRHRAAAMTTLNEELAASRAAAVTDLAAREAQLSREIAALAEREGRVRADRLALDLEREDHMRAREIFAAEADRRVREEVRATSGRINELEARIQRMLGERDSLMHELDGYRDFTARFGNDAHAILNRLAEQDARIEQLTRERDERPSLAEWSRLRAQEDELRQTLDELDLVRHERDSLSAQSHRWAVSVAELEGERERREILERRRQAMEVQIGFYEEEVKRTRSLFEQPEEMSERIDVIRRPIWTPDETRVGEAFSHVAETDWLANLHERLAETGIVFPRRLLEAFHTSLKSSEWSPLTVLAGVSGTGKSELPRLYAHYGGMLYEPTSVQPNWDSPQSLLGFFNAIDNRFNATRLLRALAQSQRSHADEGASDAMLLVLLDEMNLAHVELYFADFLSKLEQRRGLNEVALDVDMGAGAERFRIPLGRNVLWVGTMNEDETTKALSDKVIDRGHVIGFPRPQTLLSRSSTSLGEPAPKLPHSTWRRWVSTGGLDPAEARPFKEALEEINRALEQVGRAIGHRVWQAVENYMANHPAVLLFSREEAPAERDRALRTAFEDALVHKVMPKLRGIETSGEARHRCLVPIQNVVLSHAPGLSDDFELTMRIGNGVFNWASARYLTVEA